MICVVCILPKGLMTVDATYSPDIHISEVFCRESSVPFIGTPRIMHGQAGKAPSFGNAVARSAKPAHRRDKLKRQHCRGGANCTAFSRAAT
jgi:hypothetical protein